MVSNEYARLSTAQAAGALQEMATMQNTDARIRSKRCEKQGMRSLISSTPFPLLAMAAHFRPAASLHPSRFVWLPVFITDRKIIATQFCEFFVACSCILLMDRMLNCPFVRKRFSRKALLCTGSYLRRYTMLPSEASGFSAIPTLLTDRDST